MTKKVAPDTVIENGSVTSVKSGDKNIEVREQWDNKAQFLLTCIGFAVGLGNIWRFPYVLQTSGGGAFLIPYFIMLVFEGIPLLYVELSAGQLIRKGSVGTWRDISKYMGGVGICSLFVSFLVGVYYNTIISWCLWFLFNSFQSPLPWQYCPVNENRTALVPECELSSTTQYYWYRTTLDITGDISEGGGIQTNLLVCQLLAWLIVFLCLSKGIASSGKVVYVTATFPYLVLFIFLIRGLTLRGSDVGLSYLFSPDYSKLSDPNIWLTASTQIFFSLSLSFGGMIAFSSFNPRDNNCERDTLIVALVNSGTSILASVVIFSVLGFKATLEYEECVEKNIDQILNQFDEAEGSITIDSYPNYIEFNAGKLEPLNLANCSVEELLSDAASGTGLAFIVMTEAILSMPAAPFWSIIFFLMLLTLGLDSMFGTLEGVMTPLQDIGIIPKKYRGIRALIFVCIVSLLVSLVFLQGSGNYWLDVFDTYAGGLPLLIIAFFELVAVGWVFKYTRYSQEIIKMIGPAKNAFTKFLFYYWWATIPIISPILLFGVFVYYLYDKVSKTNVYDAWQEDLGQNIKLEYPSTAIAVMVVLALLCTIWIPIVAAYYLIQKYRKYRSRGHRSNKNVDVDMSTVIGNEEINTIAKNGANKVVNFDIDNDTPKRNETVKTKNESSNLNLPKAVDSFDNKEVETDHTYVEINNSKEANSVQQMDNGGEDNPTFQLED